jgi:hypothetical protein
MISADMYKGTSENHSKMWGEKKPHTNNWVEGKVVFYFLYNFPRSDHSPP